MVTEEYYLNLKNSMAKKSVKSLVGAFNKQVGNRCWTSVREIHDTVLIDTLIEKGVDVSAVYDGVDISFKKHVVLNEDLNKLFVVK